MSINKNEDSSVRVIIAKIEVELVHVKDTLDRVTKELKDLGSLSVMADIQSRKVNKLAEETEQLKLLSVKLVNIDDISEFKKDITEFKVKCGEFCREIEKVKNVVAELQSTVGKLDKDVIDISSQVNTRNSNVKYVGNLIKWSGVILGLIGGALAIISKFIDFK